MEVYVIFGAASYGRIAYQTLNNKLKITAFCDNNPNLQGVAYQFGDKKLKIFAPREIERSATAIIATNQTYWKSIEKQLDDLGIKHVTFDELVFEQSKKETHEIQEWLDDAFSKETYCKIIEARKKNDYSQLSKLYTANQYFALPEVCVQYSKFESFVDAGAFVGDTIEKYLFDRMTIFDTIYAFEPGNIQFRALQKRCARLRAEWGLGKERIVCENAALTDKTKKMNLLHGARDLGGMYVTESTSKGGEEVKAYSLDDYLKGKPVGFIKADVEGEELPLLRGAAETIRNFHPRLAICLYHNPADFIEIPTYIKSLDPAYHMAVRHHSMEYNETVLYCW